MTTQERKFCSILIPVHRRKSTIYYIINVFKNTGSKNCGVEKYAIRILKPYPQKKEKK